MLNISKLNNILTSLEFKKTEFIINEGFCPNIVGVDLSNCIDSIKIYFSPKRNIDKIQSKKIVLDYNSNLNDKNNLYYVIKSKKISLIDYSILIKKENFDEKIRFTLKLIYENSEVAKYVIKKFAKLDDIIIDERLYNFSDYLKKYIHSSHYPLAIVGGEINQKKIHPTKFYICFWKYHLRQQLNNKNCNLEIVFSVLKEFLKRFSIKESICKYILKKSNEIYTVCILEFIGFDIKGNRYKIYFSTRKEYRIKILYYLYSFAMIEKQYFDLFDDLLKKNKLDILFVAFEFTKQDYKGIKLYFG